MGTRDPSLFEFLAGTVPVPNLELKSAFDARHSKPRIFGNVVHPVIDYHALAESLDIVFEEPEHDLVLEVGSNLLDAIVIEY